jgi:hemerythrin-like domain-containing protein
METIIGTLKTEHAVLVRLYEVVERQLSGVETVSEVHLLTRLVVGVLEQHAYMEEHLAFAALDHAMAERGPLNRLHQDHQEIDGALREAAAATDLEQARQLLKTGLKASRNHFRREEEMVFPLLEKMFTPQSLSHLAAGAATTGLPSGARMRPAANPSPTDSCLTT